MILRVIFDRSQYGETTLNFAAHVMLNAAWLRTGFSNDQKQRLQKVLFPRVVLLPAENMEPRKRAYFSATLVAGVGKHGGERVAHRHRHLVFHQRYKWRYDDGYALA